MALDPQLSDFMPHVVTITPKSSMNNYGEDVHGGTARTARAYVEPRFQISGTAQVDELTQPIRAFINDVTFTYQDLITLPDGTTPDITSVERNVVVEGLEHSVVTFA
jgi:hypothetical protein